MIQGGKNIFGGRACLLAQGKSAGTRLAEAKAIQR